MTRRGWLLFATMSLLWGVPYLLIRITVAELSPFVVVAVRTGLAALVLLPLAWRAGALHALRGRWHLVLAFALVEVTVPFVLIAYGEQHVSSSLAGLLVAAVPLFVALLALRVDATERVTGSRLAGLGVGFSGVLVLLGFDVGAEPAQLVGALAILGATVCYAGGALLIKRSLADVPPLGIISAGLTLTTLLLLPPALLTAPGALPGAGVVAALLTLGVVCTAVAFLAFFALIAEAGASRATVITYVHPAVAVALGVTLLGEPATLATGAGFLLVLAGSWLSTGGRIPPGLVAGLAALATRRARRDPTGSSSALSVPVRPPLA